MERLISEIMTGFIVLALWAGISGLVGELESKAVRAHRHEPMSYSAWSKMLFKGQASSTSEPIFHSL